MTILTYTIQNLNTHNTLTLKSKVDSLVVNGVYTINNKNERIDLIIGGLTFNTINTTFGLSYKDIVSRYIYIDLELPSGLTLEDVLNIVVSNSKYLDYGEYISEVNKMDIGEFIQPVIRVENQSDTYLDVTLDIKIKDRFGNIRQQDYIPLLANNDGFLMKIFDVKDTSFMLPLEINDSSDIIIYTTDNVKIPVKEYALASSKKIMFDSRNLSGFIVLYRPSIYFTNEFTSVNSALSINKNNLIRHSIRDATSMDYRFIIKMSNLNFRTVNETPIIKTLGVVTY